MSTFAPRTPRKAWQAAVRSAFAAHEAHDEVDLTWQCAQQLRSAYKHADKTRGRAIARRADRGHVRDLPDPRDHPTRADPAHVEYDPDRS